MSSTVRDQALVDLVRDRGEALVRYGFLFTGDVTAAQDLLQEALVKVFVRTRSGFEPDTVEGYVRRAMATLYIDGRRKRRTWSGVEHLFARDGATPGPDADAAERLDLHAALATLGRQERAVVVLRYFEDLTVPQIAQQMGLADGSVKRYLSNAVHRLEQRLGPVQPPPPDVETNAVVTTGPAARGPAPTSTAPSTAPSTARRRPTTRPEGRS